MLFFLLCFIFIFIPLSFVSPYRTKEIQRSIECLDQILAEYSDGEDEGFISLFSFFFYLNNLITQIY